MLVHYGTPNQYYQDYFYKGLYLGVGMEWERSEGLNKQRSSLQKPSKATPHVENNPLHLRLLMHILFSLTSHI